MVEYITPEDDEPLSHESGKLRLDDTSAQTCSKLGLWVVGPWCLVGADFDMQHACGVAKWAFAGGTKELIWRCQRWHLQASLLATTSSCQNYMYAICYGSSLTSKW